MEPLAEPPRRAQPRRVQQPPRAVAAPAARKRRPGGFARSLRSLLIVALLIGIGAGAYVLANQSAERSVQLRERIEGNVEQAVDELQGLIEDNTR
jgi:uncharacterized protein HemX